jgi:hypothetical protein
MDETANQIEAHIDRTRDRLGSNLRELEGKIDAATDWREHFRGRPHVFLGAAFAGGVVLAGVLRSKAPRRAPLTAAASPNGGHGGQGSAQRQARELWNNIQGALLGVAAARIKDYIGEMVPGFDDQYRRAEERAAALDRSAS